MTKPEKHNVPVKEEPQGGTALVAADFGEDAGVGMDNLDRSEYKIPFLRVLDPKSPQCKPASVGGLGAKPGQIFNTATNELYDEILFVPAHRDHYYAEYLKRNDDGSGGGFVGIRSVDDEFVLQLLAAQGKFKKLVTQDDPPHEIAETYALTGIAVPCTTDPKTHKSTPVGSGFPAVIAFASTQIKKYQTFIGRAMGFVYSGPDNRQIKPPIWAHLWHITTQYEQRGQQSWYGWVIRLSAKKDDGTEAPYPQSMVKKTDQLYQDAKALYDAIVGGKAKADMAGNAPQPEADIPLE